MNFVIEEPKLMVMREVPCRVVIMPATVNQDEICPLYWILLQRRMVVLTDFSGQPIGLIFKSQSVHEKFREQLGTQVYREWVSGILLLLLDP